MVGTTLVEVRDHVEALATYDGAYYLVCGQTGERPDPVAEKRFEGRGRARNAARATEQYRRALRRRDPQLPYYNLIACQDAGSLAGSDQPEDERARFRPTRRETVSGPDRGCLIGFCHGVAAAVLEALGEAEHGGVEGAVMDARFDLAETVSDPDDLCLRLLESMAEELDTQLTPTEQANVFGAATARLDSRATSEGPVSATLARLRRSGLVDEYTRSPASVGLDSGTRSVVAQSHDYALLPRNGRLPALSIVTDLHRHRLDWPPAALEAFDADHGWRIRLTFERLTEPNGSVSRPSPRRDSTMRRGLRHERAQLWAEVYAAVFGEGEGGERPSDENGREPGETAESSPNQSDTEEYNR